MVFSGGHVWIDPAFLKWTWLESISSFVDASLSQRAYAHWEHAEGLVQVASTEFQRIDVVTTLKRAVDHRVRLLHDVYTLRDVPLANLPKNSLERLQFFGIVRPLMLGKLVALRNAIEHEDASPPDLAECKELVEFVWYFLRSTDRLATVRTESFELHSSAGSREPLGEVYSGPEHRWVTTLSLSLPSEMVSLQATSDWVVVAPHRHSLAHVPSRSAEERIEFDKQFGGPPPAAEEAADGGYHVYGRIVGPSHHLQVAVQQVLNR